MWRTIFGPARPPPDHVTGFLRNFFKDFTGYLWVFSEDPIKSCENGKTL